MATREYFPRTWKITSASGTPDAEKAYPKDNLVQIVPDGKRFRVIWTDADNVEHKLRDLLFKGGNLVGEPAMEESTDEPWNVTIEAGAVDKTLTATVSCPGCFDEAGLSGNWGAEAVDPKHPPVPHPIARGEGAPRAAKETFAKKSYFRRKWRITNVIGPAVASRSYPKGARISIDPDPFLPDGFIVSWVDADTQSHELHGIVWTEQSGKLTGASALDQPTGRTWDVTIEAGPTAKTVTGAVKCPSCLAGVIGATDEAGLSGNWGAEAVNPKRPPQPGRPKPTGVPGGKRRADEVVAGQVS